MGNKQKEPFFIAGENVKYAAAVENRIAVAQNIKKENYHVIKNFTSGRIPRSIEGRD